MMEEILMGGKKKPSKKCDKKLYNSEENFVQEALAAKLDHSVYMAEAPVKVTATV